MNTFALVAMIIGVGLESHQIALERHAAIEQLKLSGWRVVPLDVDSLDSAMELLWEWDRKGPCWPVVAKNESLNSLVTVGENDILKLSRTRYVRILIIAACEIDAPACHALAELPSLRILNVSRSKLAVPFSVIAQSANKVERLFVDMTRLSADDWQSIGRMPRLTHISAKHCQFNDVAAESLKDGKIRSIILENDELTENGILALTSISSLSSIDLSFTTPRARESIGRWKNSRHLNDWKILWQGTTNARVYR